MCSRAREHTRGTRVIEKHPLAHLACIARNANLEVKAQGLMHKTEPNELMKSVTLHHSRPNSANTTAGTISNTYTCTGTCTANVENEVRGHMLTCATIEVPDCRILWHNLLQALYSMWDYDGALVSQVLPILMSLLTWRCCLRCAVCAPTCMLKLQVPCYGAW